MLTLVLQLIISSCLATTLPDMATLGPRAFTALSFVLMCVYAYAIEGALHRPFRYRCMALQAIVLVYLL